LFALFMPFIGVLVYLIARGGSMGVRAAAELSTRSSAVISSRHGEHDLLAEGGIGAAVEPDHPGGPAAVRDGGSRSS